jgi:hypothetical protein
MMIAEASKNEVVMIDDLIAGSFDSGAIILNSDCNSSTNKVALQISGNYGWLFFGRHVIGEIRKIQPIYFEISKNASLLEQ